MGGFDNAIGLLDASTPDASASSSSGTDISTSQVETSADVQSTTDTSVDSTTTTDSSEGDSSQSATSSQQTDTSADEKAFPLEARKLFKQLRDENPDNPKLNKLIKSIHTEYEQGRAFREVYKSVQEARESQEFLREVAGVEPGKTVSMAQARDAWNNLQAFKQSVDQTDQMLYQGESKELINNIYEDMKSEGVQDNFAKLAEPILGKLKQHHPEAYYATILPHLVSGLSESGFVDSLRNLAAVTKDNPQAAQIVKGITAWWNQNVDRVEKANQGPSPEKEAFEKEKQEFYQKQTKEFRTGVAKDAESISAKSLATYLGDLRKTAYFRAFKTENLRPLANTILYNLRTELEKDKAYQTQMKALWGEKSPNKDKILAVHKTKVESIAARIVRDTTASMYPDHAKGGSAAGRIAARNDKQAAQKQLDEVSIASGKPQFVATKPKNLDRSKDPKGYLEIAGKGFIPDGKGGHRFITWRRPLV